MELAAGGDVLSPWARIHHAHSLAPARVGLPAMPIGAGFLERWPIHEEPGEISWRAGDYACVAPATFVLRDVVVHGSSGILQVGEMVVSETLAARLRSATATPTRKTAWKCGQGRGGAWRARRAGLTDLGFCRARCVVLELQMDAYVHWAFRHLSALRGLAYDCVVGRAVSRAGSIHWARWMVSSTDVAAAIGQMLGR